MKLTYPICISSLLLLAACKPTPGKNEIKISPGGVQQQTLRKGEGPVVQPGNWLKISVAQYYNDSLLRSGPDYMPYDTTMSPESREAFKDAQAGDSLEFRVPADSAFKVNRPPFATKDGFLVTRVTVKKIYASEEELKQELAKQDSLPGY